MHSGKLFALCSTNLGKHKRRVVLEEDLTVADGGEGGGATAEGALAGLLRGGVHGLPAAVARGQVCSSHPAVGPHVEVPSGEDEGRRRLRSGNEGEGSDRRWQPATSPDGVSVERIDGVQVLVQVNVGRQRDVRVVSRLVVGHGATGDT